MIEVVLDTETTGLSVKEGHRIVEIGCIELDDLVPTKKKFHTYLNPERKVSESAFKVHGYSNEFLSSKKKFINIADDFLSFIKDKKIVIHNAEFDISHINNELKIAGLEIIKKDIVIDTLELARNKFPGSSVSLDALCKRFRIDNSKREKHNAILDCELLSKVYVNLLDQKEPSLNFLNSDRNEVKEKNNKSIKYSNKIVNITEEDLKLHEKFIKTHLKKNFF